VAQPPRPFVPMRYPHARGNQTRDGQAP
jgi:hypothetical protein